MNACPTCQSAGRQSKRHEFRRSRFGYGLMPCASLECEEGTLCFANSSLAQGFHKPLLVFLSSKRIVLTYLTNAHSWIDLLIRQQSGSRFGNTPFHSVRCNRHAKSGHPVRFRPQSHRCPFRRLLISSGDEMCKCHGALREEHARIERIEPHCFVEAFDRAIGIAGVAADPATSLPGDSQIYVQLKRAIDQ